MKGSHKSLRKQSTTQWKIREEYEQQFTKEKKKNEETHEKMLHHIHKEMQIKMVKYCQYLFKLVELFLREI